MGRKFLILILILIFSAMQTTWAYADDSDVGVTQNSEPLLPKPFVNSVLFGTGAGLLVGLVLGGGISGLMRGASLGLYGGIILGWYVSSDHSRSSSGDSAENMSPPPKKISPQVNISFNF